MKVTNYLDPTTNEISFMVESNLISKYFNIFTGLFEIAKKTNASVFPEGLEVKRVNDNSARVCFKLPEFSRVVTYPTQNSGTEGNEMSSPKAGVELSTKLLNTINSIINKFVNLALHDQAMKSEFCPLDGYDYNELAKDVKSAVENGRDLVILRHYQDYLDNEKKEEKKFEYVQYRVPFGTNEYTDVALDFISGNIDRIKNTYLGKLKMTDWV